MDKKGLNKEEINLRSEEVQEVLGAVPSWILRWGIALLCAFMVVLLIGSAMFKYPDIVTTSMTLTGTVPVGKVMVRTSGRICEIYAKDGCEVREGDYLAVIENSAVTEDMVALKNFLSKVGSDTVSVLSLPSEKWNLGALQDDYINLYLILNKEQRQSRILQTELNPVLMRMRAGINNWEKSYVLVSPVDGKVAFTNIWSTNQIVTAGNIVFDVIPSDKGALVGKSMLPVAQSGKVKVGQKVNVHFDSFPDHEFGVVKGKVQNISLIPSNGFYVVDISFPEGLKTTYKKELPFMVETSAKADIITEDVSLLERFFMPLRKAIGNK